MTPLYPINTITGHCFLSGFGYHLLANIIIPMTMTYTFNMPILLSYSVHILHTNIVCQMSLLPATTFISISIISICVSAIVSIILIHCWDLLYWFLSLLSHYFWLCLCTCNSIYVPIVLWFSCDHHYPTYPFLPSFPPHILQNFHFPFLNFQHDESIYPPLSPLSCIFSSSIIFYRHCSMTLHMSPFSCEFSDVLITPRLCIWFHSSTKIPQYSSSCASSVIYIVIYLLY